MVRDAGAEDFAMMAQHRARYPSGAVLIDPLHHALSILSAQAKAYERQGRIVDDLHALTQQASTQVFTHLSLVIDDGLVSRKTQDGERHKELQAREPPRPLKRGEVRIGRVGSGRHI